MQHQPPPSDRYSQNRSDGMFGGTFPQTGFNQYPPELQGHLQDQRQNSFPSSGPPPLLTPVTSTVAAAKTTRSRKRKSPPATEGSNPHVGMTSSGYVYNTDTSQQSQSASPYANIAPHPHQVYQNLSPHSNPGHGNSDQNGDDQGHSSGSRTVTQTKRAEQNRRAQKAFRERRDQHVRELEARSTMLDQAIADANESQRRYEECRHLVDALRLENQRLLAALEQYTSSAIGRDFPNTLGDGAQVELSEQQQAAQETLSTTAEAGDAPGADGIEDSRDDDDEEVAARATTQS